jgi:hypothetical protein
MLSLFILTSVQKFKTVTLIALGSFVWSLTMVKSGLLYSFGLGFWGPNGHDGIWHLSLIESLSRGRLAMPLFAGAAIKNYHIGFDLLVAFLHRLTFIPVSWLYFQVIPPLCAIFIGIFTYNLVLAWTKSTSAALWAVFFTYFGGSLGWVVSLLRDHSLGGESLFWSQQAISTLINPPLALSFCLLLLGLWLLQTRRFVWAAVIFGLVPSIKIYGGLLGLAGLFMVSFKDKSYWKVFFIASILSVLLYVHLNLHATGLIIWQPGWFLTNLMNPDHLDWPKYFSALSTYTTGHIWIKAIPAYTVAFLIFLLGNLSLRHLSLLNLGQISKLSWWKIFLWSASVAGIIPPLLFLQQGTSWNTIQFFYYTQFFLGILAGIGLAKLKPRLLTSLLIILATLPTTAGTLLSYLPARPPAKLSSDEILALNFLSQQPPGTVLTVPFDGSAAAAAIAYPPRPLYLYESTAYISAYSQKPVYMEDQVNLNITGYDWQNRRNQALSFFKNPTRQFVTSNNIEYIYLVGAQRQPLPDHLSLLSRIFSNSLVDIYRVD